MNIDPGLIIVIGAVLIFYLRLIILQRQRAKRANQLAAPSRPAPHSKAARATGPAAQKQTAAGTKKPARTGQPAAFDLERYSILSPRRSDRIIATVGMVLLMFGMLLYSGILPLEVLKPYWWLPAASGIILFSWAFKL